MIRFTILTSSRGQETYKQAWRGSNRIISLHLFLEFGRDGSDKKGDGGDADHR